MIKELFDSLKYRYQNCLESMESCEVVFDFVQLLYYKSHQINPNRGRWYIDSNDWIKNKKTAINHINEKDNKCFKFNVTVALNYEEIKKKSAKNNKNQTFYKYI